MLSQKIDFDICLSVAKTNVDEALKTIAATQQWISMAEVRMDYLKDFTQNDLTWLVQRSPVPLLFTNRAAWEGGLCKDEDGKRLQALKIAIEAGASFVDVELRTEPTARDELIAFAKGKNVKTIVSYHDFNATPEQNLLEDILARIVASNADVAKIVTTCLCPQDIKKVMSLYFSPFASKTRLCAFCMAKAGRISRLTCIALGSPFIYVSSDEGSQTAPGQLSAECFCNIYEQLS